MLALRKGICAVVFRRKNGKLQFLLLRRVLHWTGWEFPKGGSEKGESPSKTLLRELSEELGISKKQVSSFKRIPFVQEFDDFVRNKHHKNKAFVVELSPKANVCVSKDPCKEHSSFRWVSKQQALKLLAFGEQRKVFRKALKFIAG